MRGGGHREYSRRDSPAAQSSVRAEGLRRLHHVGTGRMGLACRLKWRGGYVRGHAVLDEALTNFVAVRKSGCDAGMM